MVVRRDAAKVVAKNRKGSEKVVSSRGKVTRFILRGLHFPLLPSQSDFIAEGRKRQGQGTLLPFRFFPF